MTEICFISILLSLCLFSKSSQSFSKLKFFSGDFLKKFENSSLTITEMYAQFKEWFKEGWPNMSLPIKNEVKEYFDRLWGDAERGVKWIGYRIRTLQDDVDSGEVIILEENDLVKYETDGAAAPPM